MINLGEYRDLEIYIFIDSVGSSLVFKRFGDVYLYGWGMYLDTHLRLIKVHRDKLLILNKFKSGYTWAISEVPFPGSYSIMDINEIIFNTSYVKDLELLEDILE